MGNIFGSDLLQESPEVRGARREIPIFYVTQLAALALGVPSDQLGLESIIIDPMPLLREKQLL